jgi:uncharacterized protein (UPF0335 family)
MSDVSHIGTQRPPGPGDNSEKFGIAPTPGNATGNAPGNVAGPSRVTAGQLRGVVSRIEQLEEEKKGLGDDIRDIYTEAKGSGFDIKALRTIVRLRKMKEGDRAEQESILDTYKQALGMLV